MDSRGRPSPWSLALQRPCHQRLPSRKGARPNGVCSQRTASDRSQMSTGGVPGPLGVAKLIHRSPSRAAGRAGSVINSRRDNYLENDRGAGTPRWRVPPARVLPWWRPEVIEVDGDDALRMGWVSFEPGFEAPNYLGGARAVRAPSMQWLQSSTIPSTRTGCLASSTTLISPLTTRPQRWRRFRG